MAYIKDGSMDSISIIIRCKNEERFIGQTLQKIFGQEIEIPFEVIIIDSGSTDYTIEIVKRYSINLFQIPQHTFTFGYALNYGIDRANGNIICNLSAHCIPTSNSWLKNLVSPIINSSSHATFGRQVAIKGMNAFEEVALNKHFPDHKEIKGRIPFSNANCAFLKKMWLERKFDEELPSWEDYLWYFLQKDIYTFQYCPKAAVYHTHPFSIEAISSRAYRDGKALKMINNKYNIDFLEGVCPTLKTKAQIFLNDLKNHIKLFKEEGYSRDIFLIPIVRFFAYKAHWEGYNSIR
jgi:glycosyltransferase involved in cell wall biosynthesis